uniref:Uncharacterized protein n=1 Tax=Mycena chlorophos TaxID=658473 RepID=A0ABQ0MD09_MYCCL|nr:predicted protein [Mycena chlorophos]
MDELFLERLDTFCISSIRTFAEREGKSFEGAYVQIRLGCLDGQTETRQLVAEWHGRHLFSPQQPSAASDRATRVKSTLSDTSRILESLSATAGVESFVLAVDPTEDGTNDPGFLGGSVVGREYWRGMRGGGEPGARAFKSHCVKAFQASSPSTSTTNARTIKSTLYDAVRTALRTASGVRNAEMKWTNPALLNIYGVALVGWPPSIPAQNPSSLKADQNKQLLEALENGTMYFTRILAMPQQSSDPSRAPTPPVAPPSEDESSFAWAIQYEPEPLSTSGEDEGDRPAKRARPG